jgi:hypothetical protein
VKPLPDTAPRGKAFAVSRFNCVVGPTSRLVLGTGRWTARKDAEKARDAIDVRLDPAIVLVDAS